MVTISCAYVDSINKRDSHMMFTDMSKFRAYMRRKSRDGMGIDYINYWISQSGNINVSIRLFPIEDLVICQPGYQSVKIYNNPDSAVAMIYSHRWNMKYNYLEYSSLTYVKQQL